MSDTQIDIGMELGRGWNLYKANMGLLVVAVLIGMAVSGLTCGILSGPMGAGLFLIIQRLMQNDPIKPQAGDVFKGFDFFLQAFLCFLIVGVVSFVLSLLLNLIPVLGQLASMVISMFSGSVMMWALMYVVYQKMTAVDALKKLVDGVKSGAFVMPLVFGLIACFLGGIGVFVCLIGVIFTAPLSYCSLACAYETLYGTAEASTPPVEPEVIPSADLRL
jgi:hypothetical protein